jgi:hypothetical protein
MTAAKIKNAAAVAVPPEPPVPDSCRFHFGTALLQIELAAVTDRRYSAKADWTRN